MTDENKGIFMGVDVSKKMLEVAFDSKGKTHKISNDQGGVDSLVKMVDPSQVMLVVMEATGGLESLAATTLYAAGFSVIVANPRHAHHFAKGLGHLAKTDSIDAKVLSQYAKMLHSNDRLDQLLYKPQSPAQRSLSNLVSQRNHAVYLRKIEKTYLSSSDASNHPFVQEVIKLLDAQITTLDALIAKALDEDFDDTVKLFKDIKGIGPNTEAMLMASLPELGSLNRREIAKLAGVAPLNHDSGNFKGKRTIWGGRADVRTALYMATVTAMRCEPVIKDFYEKLTKDKGKPAKVALVACMHKLLRIVNGIVRTKTAWQPNFSHTHTQAT
jgi:transposase